jgi:hypothetical protein
MEHREDDKLERVTPSSATPRKQPYVPPRLRVYGDVAELTRTIGRKSMKADGGSRNMSKTG